jgi:hypothetical protein
MTLLPIHITAGALGIVSGFVALFALKGARLHRKSGVLKDGYPAMLFFIFGAVTWLAAVGDARMILANGAAGLARPERV